MPAAINPKKFRIGQQPVKFFSHFGRGNLVVSAPNNTSRGLELRQIFSHIVANSTLGNGQGLYEFTKIVYQLINLVNHFFSSDHWIVKYLFSLLFNVFVISTLGVAVSHGVLVKPRTSSDNQGLYV